MSVFSLQGQGLKLDTRADIEPHLATLDPAKLEEIHLGGNTLGVEACEALGEVLGKCTNIRVADFADIFTGRLISEIPLCLTSILTPLIPHSHLHTLNLSDNAFGGRSVDPIIPILSQSSSLSTLLLNNNGLGPAGGSEIATALLKRAQTAKQEGKPSKLRKVVCGRNRLEDGSAPRWAEAFKEHGGLVEVRMPQNGIRMDGIVKLAEGLGACPDLEILDLQDNAFGVAGDKAFSEVLPKLPKLKVLNFSDCVLSLEESNEEPPKVIEALAEGSNPKIETLQLQNNNLTGDSVRLLADSVGKSLTGLKFLELQWNEFEEDEEGVQTLTDNLRARGGKFFISDEEEEEEEPEIIEEAEAEEAAEPVEVEGKALPAGLQPKEEKSKEEAKGKSILDKAADTLADLMGKVSLGN